MGLLWWAAGEEIEFPRRASGVVSSTSSTARRAAFTRTGLVMAFSNTGGAVLCDGMPLSTPLTSLWLSCQFYPSGSPFVDRPMLGFGKSDFPSGGVFIGTDGANASKLALFKVTSAGTVTKLVAESGMSFTYNMQHRVDIQVIDFDGTCTINVYIDSTSLPTLSYTGSVTSLGFTTLDCLRVMSNGSGATGYLSEVIIADSDTRAFVGVASLAPNGAGSVNTFDVGDYTDVDEAVLDEADLLSSATAAQEFNCALSALPAGDYSVKGLKVVARASKGASGPDTLKIGITSGGSDDTVDRVLSLALDTSERLMLVNPLTGVAFTNAEVNALEVCLKSA